MEYRQRVSQCQSRPNEMSFTPSVGYIRQEHREMVYIVFANLVSSKPCVGEVCRQILWVAIESVDGSDSPL